MKSHMFVALLLVVEPAGAQTPPQSSTLTIKGHPGKAPLIQLDGKSYVEVEALARLANGSITFKGKEITLALPAPLPGAESQTAVPPAKRGYSREFLRAVIEETAVIREWRIAIVNAIQYSYPVTEEWIGAYRRAAESKLELVSAALITDADREGLLLLRNVFGKMQQFSDKYLAMHKSMTYVAPDSLANDPLDSQILGCARSLASLSVGGQFQDVAVCH